MATSSDSEGVPADLNARLASEASSLAELQAALRAASEETGDTHMSWCFDEWSHAVGRNQAIKLPEGLEGYCYDYGSSDLGEAAFIRRCPIHRTLPRHAPPPPQPPVPESMRPKSIRDVLKEDAIRQIKCKLKEIAGWHARVTSSVRARATRLYF